MCNLDPFKIDLKGLEVDVKTLNFSLMDDFFEAIDATEVRKGKLSTTAQIRKGANFFELDLDTKGMVVIPCDRCLDDMEQPIDAQAHYIIKLGETSSEDDDMITVPEETGVLDISWLIYETIALDIPIKHVHAPGKCNVAMENVLNEHTAARSSDGDDADDIDPRWSALKNLKIE